MGPMITLPSQEPSNLLRRILVVFISLSLLAVGNSAMASTKYQQVNADLKQTLSQHQSYADTDPGNYDYAKFIQKIQYRGDGNMIVKVNPGFRRMSRHDKDQVMNQVQALAKMIVINDQEYSTKKINHGLKATIKERQSIVGRSRPHHPDQYKWQ